jgi:hypothetical protein
MLCHQPGGAEASATVAAVARHVQHWEADGDLAKGDEAGGHRVHVVKLLLVGPHGVLRSPER